MALPQGIAAVMVDLDGTLLDTLPDLASAANRMLAALGLAGRPQEQIGGYIGKGIPNLVRRCLDGEADTLQAKGLPLFEAFYFEESGRHCLAYPGVVEGLQRFAAMHLPLACVTNKTERFTLSLLEHMALARYFSLVVSGDTLPRKKPDPMQLLHICAQFGLPPSRVLLIGDSSNDALAARAAGCPVACVSYGYNEGRDVHDLDCDAIVASLEEAAQLVQNAGFKTQE
jgi:phosphoglycolate phosphatase